MGNLYIIRHSVSYYNENEIFAGNMDIPLSSNGIKESIKIGEEFRNSNFDKNIDIVFTSTLSRSFDTALLFLSKQKLSKTPIVLTRKCIKTKKYFDSFIPIFKISNLNERNYGILQNMTKADVEKMYSSKQIYEWRRAFHSGPTAGETFEQVYNRVKEFYDTCLLSILKEKDVLIVAHQNTIRALYMIIYDISKNDISEIEFPNSKLIFIDKFN